MTRQRLLSDVWLFTLSAFAVWDRACTCQPPPGLKFLEELEGSWATKESSLRAKTNQEIAPLSSGPCTEAVTCICLPEAELRRGQR